MVEGLEFGVWRASSWPMVKLAFGCEASTFVEISRAPVGACTRCTLPTQKGVHWHLTIDLLEEELSLNVYFSTDAKSFRSRDNSLITRPA